MRDPNKLFMWSGNGIPNNVPQPDNDVTAQLREAARQREILKQEMLHQELKRSETGVEKKSQLL